MGEKVGERSEVVTVVAVKIPAFRDMTPCDWYISDIVEELSPSFVRVPVQYRLKILEISSINF